MKNVCIIPARGGSKRIPRKNIKIFAGRPMIGHSILSAIGSGIFDRVIVSTDDPEITSVAKEFGAEVPFIRPAELSDDYTNTTDVISHSINWLRNTDLDIKAVCCIYATAPFIQVSDLVQAEKIFHSGNWEYVFSATTFGFPIFRSIKKNTDGSIEMFYPEHFNTRSQDLPEAYHDAGQFYFGKPDAWLSGKKIFDIGSTIVDLPRWRVQDIDTLEDWDRAEVLYKLLNQSKSSTT
ncbi:pseudaminic acid cytidylyltransferase [Leptospira perdikensis]|uniref:pseudaminic acid cytidylyltransferase n=1 Tax=Leptospira perdikensis TaxID=2484948 RepID=UPI001ABF5C05|nr:pseudaminic acid cytidylyltransferase [Leptospira perdikensis]